MDGVAILKRVIDEFDLMYADRVELACKLLWECKPTAETKELFIENLHPAWMKVAKES